MAQSAFPSFGTTLFIYGFAGPPLGGLAFFLIALQDGVRAGNIGAFAGLVAAFCYFIGIAPALFTALLMVAARRVVTGRWPLIGLSLLTGAALSGGIVLAMSLMGGPVQWQPLLAWSVAGAAAGLTCGWFTRAKPAPAASA